MWPFLVYHLHLCIHTTQAQTACYIRELGKCRQFLKEKAIIWHLFQAEPDFGSHRWRGITTSIEISCVALKDLEVTRKTISNPYDRAVTIVFLRPRKKNNIQMSEQRKESRTWSLYDKIEHVKHTCYWNHRIRREVELYRKYVWEKWHF